MNPTEQTQLHPALERLFGRINYERQDAGPRGELKLDAVRQFAEALGNPERDYPIVHVAGTKGKGSVTAMAGSILHSAGLRCGTYTSPHLESLNQRFVIDGIPISDQRLVRLLEGIWPYVDESDQANDSRSHRRLTFFDIATAAAFRYFSEENVEVAAIEVGLGGRLDSTNICVPAVSVITSISFDHCRQLGDTLERIATEKAGIIKPHIPVVSGVTEPIPRETIQRIARKRGAPCYQINSDFHISDVTPDSCGLHFTTSGTIQGHAYEFQEIRLPMFGRHQANNAATAIAAVMALAKSHGFDPEPFVRGALSDFQHPGRIERVSERPTIILDVAHNVASIEALIQTVRDLEVVRPFGRRVGLIAISRDKDQLGMLKRLASYFDQLVFTRFVENPRATEPDSLRQWAAELPDAEHLPELLVAETPDDAWKLVAGSLQADDLCVVTGSVFLVAELRPKFLVLGRNSSGIDHSKY